MIASKSKRIEGLTRAIYEKVKELDTNQYNHSKLEMTKWLPR